MCGLGMPDQRLRSDPVGRRGFRPDGGCSGVMTRHLVDQPQEAQRKRRGERRIRALHAEPRRLERLQIAHVQRRQRDHR